MQSKVSEDAKKLKIIQPELKKAEDVIIFLRKQMASLQAKTKQTYSSVSCDNGYFQNTRSV